MTRLPLLVCVLALTLRAADTDLNRVLKGVEEHYNRAKTLKVQFTESYIVNGHPRRQESGELTLRKPGRMRWDYSMPAGKLFISDGKDVYLYTPEAHRVEKMRLKESEDWRAPLAFLLGKLDFQKEFKDFSLKPQGPDFEIEANAKSDHLPYEHIAMLVTQDYVIKRLTVTGQDKSVLTFDLDQERVNPPVDDARFHFDIPAGASIVNGDTGQ